MLNFLTPLALAALTAISIAPQAQAFPINIDSISIGQSSRSTQPPNRHQGRRTAKLLPSLGITALSPP